MMPGLSTISEPRIVLRRLKGAAALVTSAASPDELPADLLRQASRRLQVMALMSAALWVAGPVLNHLGLHAADAADPRWAEFLPVDGVALASFLASLALWAYLRRSERAPRQVIGLALLYLVVAALATGLLTHWGAMPNDPMTARPTITWIGPGILMVAAIVPVPPTRMLACGLLAALMAPAGMLIMTAMGHWPHATLAELAVMHWPDVVLAGVAAVISHVVTGLGRQITRARELGSYQLGELLGEGGMGQVFRATHRMLARPAAIKLIRPETLAGENPDAARLALARFRREAEAAARLRSPHTVELYDFGIAADGTVYTVMELLDGMSLQDLVERYGPMPAGRVVHVLRQVCDSLAEAHAAGLVHRDIKPGNIHLGRLALRHDVAKVLDFGLVKSVAGAAVEQSLATVAGYAPGTPAYMAPETVSDDGVDGRTDLYALGCVAYFLLTGRLVFDAVTPLQMLARHLQDEPLAPSRWTDEPLPAALDDLVLACLAKCPADRPVSAQALARALDALPVERWTEEQAAEWWHAHDRRLLTGRRPAPILTLTKDNP